MEVDPDITLGGYFAEHERPPAFEGKNRQPYSVAIYVPQEPEDTKGFGAALLFIRWSEAGDRPLDHLESEYLAWGATAEEAEIKVGELTLYEVKEHLDRLIDAADGGKAW